MMWRRKGREWQRSIGLNRFITELTGCIIVNGLLAIQTFFTKEYKEVTEKQFFAIIKAPGGWEIL
jgi:hypothetical protein